MANYIGTFRSNYFKVKDLPAFKAWVETLESEDEVTVWDRDGTVALGGNCSIPMTLEKDEDDVTKSDFIDELAMHLVPKKENVAILQEVGSEKLRYLSGFSIAINHEGEVARTSISDIYETLSELGVKNVSECTY